MTGKRFGSPGQHYFSPLVSRPNTFLTARSGRWSDYHITIVLDGLRQHRSYPQIADNLISERPDTDSKEVAKLIENAGGLEQFLQKHIFDPVEIEGILEFYKDKPRNRGGRRSLTEKAKYGLPKYSVIEPRPLRDNVLAERDQLERLVANGIQKHKSYSAIVDEAKGVGIPCDTRTIEKMIRSRRGHQGFLEHMGLSTLEARQLAATYESA